jgi:predicted transcriptional regulator
MMPMGSGMFRFDGPKLTQEILLRELSIVEFAAEAGVAAATVRRACRGEAVYLMCALRIEKTLRGLRVNSALRDLAAPLAAAARDESEPGADAAA